MNNILEVFKAATHEDFRYGLSWYPYASFVASEYAKDLGVSKEKVCGVISSLSPRNKWERNLKDAYNLIKAWQNNEVDKCKVCTFGANKAKAIKILEGEPISEVLTGPKTWNFYNNILNPGSNHVTIDFHAANIHDGEIGSRSLTKKDYRVISEAYVSTANLIGIQPSALQAITWVVWRENREELVNQLNPLR